MLKAVIPPTLKLFPLLLIDKCPYPRKPRFSYLRVPCVIVNVYYKAGRFLGVQWEWISQQTATPYTNLLMLWGFLKFLNMIWCFKKCHPIYLLYSLLFTCGSYYPIMPGSGEWFSCFSLSCSFNIVWDIGANSLDTLGKKMEDDFRLRRNSILICTVYVLIYNLFYF